MKLMKRWMALLMVLCMLPGCVAAAEEPVEVAETETVIVEEVPAEEASSWEDYLIVDGVLINSEGDVVEGVELAEGVQETIEILDAEIDDTVDPENLELNANLPDHVVNILLIGIDSRSEDLAEHNQHGDVQIIVSINKKDGSIKLTSILRDLYVTIPGYKSKNRINVAYKRGGGELAMRTVNHNFDMNIEHYIVINFYGLASIIDALGGVDMEMTKREAGAINTYLRKHPPAYDNQDDDYERVELQKVDGVQHLDGIQAVMYARLRSIDNDFARTARQRKLLEVLLGDVLEGGLDFNKLLLLLETCLPYAKTNMKFNDLFTLALGVLNGGILDKLSSGESLLEQSRIPMDETWKYDTTSEGASVVAFRTSKRLKENIEKLHQFIYGEYYPAD